MCELRVFGGGLLTALKLSAKRFKNVLVKWISFIIVTLYLHSNIPCVTVQFLCFVLLMRF